MIPLNWNQLQRAVENQNCILLLGPGASGSMVGGNFVPFTTQFSGELAAELDAAKVDFDQTNRDDLDYIAQLYLNDPNATELEAAYAAKTFYSKNAKTPPDFLVKLAKLPFKIVVNTTPDDLFMAAFQAAGKVGRVFDFYNYWRPKEFKFEKPTVDNPLVFNLFGHYLTPESLVLTANNQVDFIGKVNRDNPPLPARLLEEFDGSKTYLFVGFDWREWHTQLLMKTLRLTKESSILTPNIPSFNPPRASREIFKSLFTKFIFAEEHLDDFIGILADKFAAAPPETPVAETGKRIFISYLFSADDGLKDLIFNHLRGIEQAGLAHFWHEEMLAFGDNREAKIAEEIAKADFILMLITAEYLTDDVTLSNQFQPALARARDGKASVVPVILKPSPWQLVDDLKKMPVILPNPGTQPGKAVTTWTNQDEAFQNVVENLKNLLK
jgi:SIR2-like domain/TIR domain